MYKTGIIELAGWWHRSLGKFITGVTQIRVGGVFLILWHQFKRHGTGAWPRKKEAWAPKLECQKYHSGIRWHVYTCPVSSIGLVFFNPTSHLRCTDVIAFCMQLRNSEDIPSMILRPDKYNSMNAEVWMGSIQTSAFKLRQPKLNYFGCRSLP